MNKTYLWYGKKSVRDRYQQNQIAQDKNAFEQSGSAGFGGGRGQTKASALYRNFGRDLIDTFDEDKSIVEKIKKEDLPEKMQSMSDAEKTAYIKSLSTKRNEIKKKILELSRERELFAAKKRQELARESGDDTLGDAIGAAVREQLKKSGFEIKK